jgi:hypothetical protein
LAEAVHERGFPLIRGVQTGNDNWGQQRFWNNSFLERYMLGFDAHYGKHFRTFVEFKSGLESYRIGGLRPIDEKKLDFQNPVSIYLLGAVGRI